MPPRRKAKQSRTRSGCLTCRDRHMKCDEHLPVCHNCINSKRKCYRGIRLNFTQYTIYDPPTTGVGEAPLFFRILDQSIAVLSQYHNGKARYRPYMHLHSPADLEEAAARFLYDETPTLPPAKHDTMASVPEHARTLDLAPAAVTNELPMSTVPEVNTLLDPHQAWQDDIIFESFDITQILMNPSSAIPEMPDAGINASFIPMVDFPVAHVDELHTTSVDPDAIVQLMFRHRYYWLLDLFNDMAVWRTMVPSYCIRQEHSGTTRALLVLCLINCRPHTPMTVVEATARTQAQLWKDGDVGVHVHEPVLVSVVLILLSMLDLCKRPEYTMCNTFTMVMANQGRLLRQLGAYYSKASHKETSMMVAAAFQAVMILRFFLRKLLRRQNQDSRHAQSQNQLQSNLNLIYDLSLPHNLDDFFVLLSFEQTLLSTRFRKLDITTKSGSDAARLRELFWTVVECDYYMSPMHVAPPVLVDDDSSVAALRPNDTCIAYSIIAAYAQRRQYDADTDFIMHEIFRRIDGSSFLLDTKDKWSTHFRWTLDDVPNH